MSTCQFSGLKHVGSSVVGRGTHSGCNDARQKIHIRSRVSFDLYDEDAWPVGKDDLEALLYVQLALEQVTVVVGKPRPLGGVIAQMHRNHLSRLQDGRKGGVEIEAVGAA